jgi:general secretion pathway protein M
MAISSNSYQVAIKRLAQRWQALAPREQTLIGAAAAVVVLALLWWVALAPALGVLKTANAQRSALDAQLQQMQALQAQANALQGQAKMNLPDAARALEASVKQRLGAAAQLSVAGSQATLTLKNAPADALAQWLGQARTTAKAVPSQARLRVNTSNPSAWDGTLVLSLPAQP